MVGFKWNLSDYPMCNAENYNNTSIFTYSLAETVPPLSSFLLALDPKIPVSTDTAIAVSIYAGIDTLIRVKTGRGITERLYQFMRKYITPNSKTDIMTPAGYYERQYRNTNILKENYPRVYDSDTRKWEAKEPPSVKYVHGFPVKDKSVTLRDMEIMLGIHRNEENHIQLHGKNNNWKQAILVSEDHKDRPNCERLEKLGHLIRHDKNIFSLSDESRDIFSIPMR